MADPYLSNEDFFSVYSKVPRLNIDLVIQSPEGVLLALRTIEPNEGFWHFPGGTVYRNELIMDAAKRIAKKETGLTIEPGKCLGYMEFPNEMRAGVGIHTVSLAIEAVPVEGELRHDENAKELKYFKILPEKMIKEHAELLKRFNLPASEK